MTKHAPMSSELKLVPVEPTWKMQIAGRDAILAEDDFAGVARPALSSSDADPGKECEARRPRRFSRARRGGEAVKARSKPVMERIRAHVAAGILGVEVRTVQALAARGEVPGAAKIGGLWTFDEAALRNWIRERTTCSKNNLPRNTATGEATRFGRALPLQARNSAKAYEQTLRELRRGV